MRLPLSFALLCFAPALALAQPAEAPHDHDHGADHDHARGRQVDIGDSAHAEDNTAHGGHGGHEAPPINYTDMGYSDKDAHGGTLEKGETPMAPPLLLAILNFLVFAGLIGWKAGPALRRHFNRKHETIKTALEEAARMRQEAAEKLEDYGKRIADVDSEVKDLIEQIRQEAEAERQKILADAEAEAARTKAEAEARIAAEIEAAKRSLEREVVAAAAMATEKLLRDKTSPSDQSALFTTFIAGIDASAAPAKSTPPTTTSGGPTDDGWS